MNNELYQTPVLPNGEIIKQAVDEQYIDHVRTGFYKLEIENLQSFELQMRKGQNHQTLFQLKNNEWVFDRSHSGEVIIGKEEDDDSLHGIRKMPYISSKKHEIYIVLDEFSVEIFVDGKSLTSLIYPDLDDDLFDLQIKAEKVVLYKFLDKVVKI